MNNQQFDSAKRLGEYLVEAGLLSPGQVEVALYDQARTKMRFGEVVVQRGWVDQRTIDLLLHQQVRNRLRVLLRSKPSIEESFEESLCQTSSVA